MDLESGKSSLWHTSKAYNQPSRANVTRLRRLVLLISVTDERTNKYRVWLIIRPLNAVK